MVFFRHEKVINGLSDCAEASGSGTSTRVACQRCAMEMDRGRFDNIIVGLGMRINSQLQV